MGTTELQFIPESPFPDDGQSWPSRSCLYALPPIGVGTPWVEGLLSYVNRLAAAHSVSPRRLVRDAFSLASPELVKYRRAGPFFKVAARSANGLHRFSEYFVQAIETLCRINARGLTMLPLQKLLPFNGPALFASNTQWCPACYAEMLASEQEIFQPLVWSFDFYRVCPKHGVELTDRCPACGSHQEVIPQLPLMGFCGHCGVWLGKASSGESGGSESPALWYANALGEIVAELQRIGQLATRDRFVKQLNRATSIFAEGSRRRFCLEIGLSEAALQYLLGSDKRPTLSMWLNIAYGVGIGPVEFLKTDFDWPAQNRLLRPLAERLRVRSTKHCLSAIQRQAVEKELSLVVQASEGMVSVSELARKLKLGRSCLRYFWPDLCHRIGTDYMARQKALAEERLAQRYNILKAAIDAIVARGAYPSQLHMNKELAGSGVSLVHPAIRAEYRRCLAALKKT